MYVVKSSSGNRPDYPANVELRMPLLAPAWELSARVFANIGHAKRHQTAGVMTNLTAGFKLRRWKLIGTRAYRAPGMSREVMPPWRPIRVRCCCRAGRVDDKGIEVASAAGQRLQVGRLCWVDRMRPHLRQVTFCARQTEPAGSDTGRNRAAGRRRDLTTGPPADHTIVGDAVDGLQQWLNLVCHQGRQPLRGPGCPTVLAMFIIGNRRGDICCTGFGLAAEGACRELRSPFAADVDRGCVDVSFLRRTEFSCSKQPERSIPAGVDAIDTDDRVPRGGPAISAQR